MSRVGRTPGCHCSVDVCQESYRSSGRSPGHGLAAPIRGLPTIRNVVVIDVERSRDAYRYGVPDYKYVAERDSLADWASQKTPEELADYRRQNNEISLDGLAGLDVHKPI